MRKDRLKLDYSVTYAKLYMTDGKERVDITDNILSILENVFIKEFGGLILEGSKNCSHYKLSAELI